MKVVGFIPARGGSKGVPGKNKKLFSGKPLISYTIEAAIASDLADIVVSSDDEEILDIARDYNIKAIKRPEELSGDLAPTLPVLRHAISAIGGSFDAVMTLQPTSPLRTTAHINEAIAAFKNESDADSLVSVVQVPHNFTPGSLMVKEEQWLKHYEPQDKPLRRQDKPVIWARNGAAVYITRIDSISEYIVGGKILPYLMSKLESIDIDDMEDWVLAEALFTYLNANPKK